MSARDRKRRAVTFQQLRGRIDAVDDKLLALLNRRQKIALEIGKIKDKHSQGAYAPVRERDVYERLLKANKGPLQAGSLRAIYREVMSATRAVQQPLRVAYLGPEATFTHLASRTRFGSSVRYVAVASIADVFTEVECGRADYGVVPVENSTEGVVSHTLDMFIDSELLICSEVQLEITQNLLARCGLKGIRTVVSHSQALAQCRGWLEENLPGVPLEEVSSTAEASRVAVKRKGVAAVGSELAAPLYGLRVVVPNIHDVAENYTRFLVVGRTENEPSGRDKTSVMFSVKDRVGALHLMLEPFRTHRINLTKIESRPSRRKAWDYYFFVDCAGHCRDLKVRKALAKLGEQSMFLKVLGSYPVAK